MYQAVAIGASAGGSAALSLILPFLPASYPLAVVLVMHLHPLQSAPALAYHLDSNALPLREAEEKQPVRPGCIYFAPANYHLLVEVEHTFSLSVDEKVNFTRPSIDVLFESAADAFGKYLVGVVLSGANHDGAEGLRAIKRRGGLAVVQEPSTAEAAFMPQAALDVVAADYVLSPVEIGQLLASLSGKQMDVFKQDRQMT